MKLLFDATDGARFQNGRIPIGASDYAIDRYTLERDRRRHGDDVASRSSATSSSSSRTSRRRWPSSRHQPVGQPVDPADVDEEPTTPIDGGNMKEDATNLQAFALYLAKFVEEYGKIGIKIKAIHPQNEPGYETRYPSCLWTAAGMTTFIGTYLGPTFTSRNITAKIYLGTMSNNEDRQGRAPSSRPSPATPRRSGTSRVSACSGTCCRASAA